MLKRHQLSARLYLPLVGVACFCSFVHSTASEKKENTYKKRKQASSFHAVITTRIGCVRHLVYSLSLHFYLHVYQVCFTLNFVHIYRKNSIYNINFVSIHHEVYVNSTYVVALLLLYFSIDLVKIRQFDLRQK